MMTPLTTALTQRALDNRKPPPTVVRWAATWHAPTRKMLDELNAVDDTLRTTATDNAMLQPSFREGTGDLARPAHAEPQSAPDGPFRLAPLAWAAVAALAALGGWWVATRTTPPTTDAPGRIVQAPTPDNGILAVETPAAAQDPLAVLTAMTTWPANWSPPAWPGTSALAVRVEDDAVARGVRQLGAGLEQPLRQEWSRLVRDLSAVVDALGVPGTDPLGPDDAAPASEQSRAGRGVSRQA